MFNKFWIGLFCVVFVAHYLCIAFFGCGVSTVFIPIISHLVYEILYFDSNFFDRVAN